MVSEHNIIHCFLPGLGWIGRNPFSSSWLLFPRGGFSFPGFDAVSLGPSSAGLGSLCVHSSGCAPANWSTPPDFFFFFFSFSIFFRSEGRPCLGADVGGWGLGQWQWQWQWQWNEFQIQSALATATPQPPTPCRRKRDSGWSQVKIGSRDVVGWSQSRVRRMRGEDRKMSLSRSLSFCSARSLSPKQVWWRKQRARQPLPSGWARALEFGPRQRRELSAVLTLPRRRGSKRAPVTCPLFHYPLLLSFLYSVIFAHSYAYFPPFVFP